MSKLEIVRAWKDTEYRSHLSDEELALLPEHPAGSIELDEGDLELVQGANTAANLSAGCVGWGCRIAANVVSVMGLLAIFCLAHQVGQLLD